MGNSEKWFSLLEIVNVILVFFQTVNSIYQWANIFHFFVTF